MAQQSGFSIGQTQAGLTSWSPEGSGKTNLKTKVWMTDSQGKEITVKETNPMPIWEYLPPGSKIHWEVETLSKNEGKSDKFQIDIGYGNEAAIFREFQGVMGGMTEEERRQFNEGSKVMYDRVVNLTQQNILDKSIPPVVTIYSKELETGNDGKASGVIPIAPNWPVAIFNMNIHYGYDYTLESRTWADAVLEGMIEVALVLVSVLIMFIPGVNVVYGTMIGVALVVAEVAYAIADAMLWTGYGPSTENKYEVSFPDMGFNHSYGFGNDPSMIEEEGVFGGFDIEKNPLPFIVGTLLIVLAIRKVKNR